MKYTKYILASLITSFLITVGTNAQYIEGENYTPLKEDMFTTMEMPMTTSVEIDTTSVNITTTAIDETTVKISTNDTIFLTHLRKNVKTSHQKKIDKLLLKIESKTGKMHPRLANTYYDKWIKAIDNKKFDILMKYPQDIALPEKINDQFLVLSLLKLEIEVNLKKY